MESLLTPLVGRLLSRFVKIAAGSDGSDLRASLQGGNVSLHNLELNLDSLLHKLPVAVERAFAMQLTVSIPWTRLNSQPIEVFSRSLCLGQSLRLWQYEPSVYGMRICNESIKCT